MKLAATDGRHFVPTLFVRVEHPGGVLRGAEPENLRDVRPEEHVKLARYALRGLSRQEDEEDDLGFAIVVLVDAAQRWNAGRVACAWTSFAVNRIRWEWIRRNFNRGKPRRVPEVPLFTIAADGSEDELHEPEWLAVEDPALRQAETRADVERLLAGLGERERYVLERRYGIRGEPATLDAIGEEFGVKRERARQIERRAMERLRKRATRGTFTIPLDSARSERLR